MEIEDLFYTLYKNSRNLLEDFNANTQDDDPPELLEIVKTWKAEILAIESSHPHIQRRYESNKSIQNSFTGEQKDFICYQIGEWYLEWKHRIICDLEDGTHRLGFAKEQLKTMICGD